MALIADKLRQPFMPWQRLVADVGGEIDPDTGLPAYREVLLTVPRQSGKTTLFLSWQINRCVSRRWAHPQRSAFTAQTGKDARDKWIDELFPLIRNSGLRSLVATRRTGGDLRIDEGMGNESIRFKTGSMIRLLSTSTTSGHSKTLHQAVMDEVWHDTDDRREQGLRPAMITVADAQLLVCSTAGTELSTVLNRKIEIGRAAAAADAGTGVAYFEWSAPEGWDPDDEDSYFSFMPALCPRPPCRCAGPGESWRHTITSLAAIRAERGAMDTAEFCRAYGNIKTGAHETKWAVVKEAEWTNAQDPLSAIVGPLVFAIDVSPDRSRASIAVAGARADGDLHVAVVASGAGTGWVIGWCVERQAKWKPSRWVLDHNEALAVDMIANQLEVTPIGATDAAMGFGLLYDGLTRPAGEIVGEGADAHPVRRVWHVDDPDLTEAVKVATTRSVGVSGKAWDCKDKPADMTRLVSVTRALWGYAARPIVIVRPPATARPSTETSSSVFRPTGRLKI